MGNFKGYLIFEGCCVQRNKIEEVFIPFLGETCEQLHTQADSQYGLFVLPDALYHSPLPKLGHGLSCVSYTWDNDSVVIVQRFRLADHLVGQSLPGKCCRQRKNIPGAVVDDTNRGGCSH